MLVSLTAGRHGPSTDDDKVIDTVVRKLQAELALTYTLEAPTRLPPELKTMAYWIGEYRFDQYHAVELIDGNNIREFEQGLLQDQLYRPESHAPMVPAMILLTEDLRLEPACLSRLQTLSVPVLQSPFPIKTVLRNLAYSAAEQGQHTIRHGVMMSIEGQGVLISGESGLGKSGVALELVSRGHCLIADDTPLLHRPPQSEQIFALSSPLLADLLDVRGAGVLDISRLFGQHATRALCTLDLNIELVRDYRLTAEQCLNPFNTRTKILGLDIPHLQIPVPHTTNLALLVETITRNHVLYRNGNDAGARLIAQQQQLIDKQTQ